MIGSWNALATAGTPGFLNSKAGEILSTGLPSQYTMSEEEEVGETVTGKGCSSPGVRLTPPPSQSLRVYE
jgi:hypothetical protein